jgi:PPK2 family polyphosphate:nucleotide phosphotransferase
VPALPTRSRGARFHPLGSAVMPTPLDHRLPDGPVDLDRLATRADGGWDKEEGKAERNRLRERIADLQRRLHAEGAQSLLVVLQSMDTGGKDSTIRRVFKGVNPKGVRVTSFGRPTQAELAHDFLWRVHAAAPAAGTIGVFNRSHYEDVLAARVRGLVPPAVWQARFAHILAFEELLASAGTRIIKVFLHISRQEQRERLEKRVDRPDKHWKLDPSDLEDRTRWDDYQAAYADALRRTSTDRAPWHVVPADRRWYRDIVVARLIVETLEDLDPRWPDPPADLDALTIPE